MFYLTIFSDFIVGSHTTIVMLLLFKQVDLALFVYLLLLNWSAQPMRFFLLCWHSAGDHTQPGHHNHQQYSFTVMVSLSSAFYSECIVGPIESDVVDNKCILKYINDTFVMVSGCLICGRPNCETRLNVCFLVFFSLLVCEC